MTRRMTAEAGISASACAQVTVPTQQRLRLYLALSVRSINPLCGSGGSEIYPVDAARRQVLRQWRRDRAVVRKRGSTQCMFQTRRAENNTFSAQACFDKLSRPIFARCGGSQGRFPNLIPPSFSRRTLQHHPSLLPPQASAGFDQRDDQAHPIGSQLGAAPTAGS